jgi:homoserine O-succinyltransferase
MTQAPPLVIGLVNNMPDAALRTTERQFRELLAAAVGKRRVALRIFAAAELPRAEAARGYVHDHYEDVGALWSSDLDGLIVTGTEPRAPRIDAEASFPLTTRLVDWAEDRAVPTIWSCLAAHAAVYYLDGVERRTLGAKLSGVFRCDWAGDGPPADPVDRTAPRFVPHSRCNELPEEALAASGYRILARSDEAGVDMFARSGNSAFLFLQGHPEYDAGALLREYRRDVGRYLAGERSLYPELPVGYLPAAATDGLLAFRDRALRHRAARLLADFPERETARVVIAAWRPAALRLYENWLSGLDGYHANRSSRTRSSSPIGVGFDANAVLS